LIASAGIIAPVIPPSIGFVIFGVAQRVDHQAVHGRHRARPDDGPGALITWWWVARKENVTPPPKASRAEVWPPRCRTGGLGAVPAGDRARGPEDGRVHADRGGRGRRHVRAVRRPRSSTASCRCPQLVPVLLSAAKTTAVIMFLVAAAMVSAWLITVADLPAELTACCSPSWTARRCC
jgi:TRAP-type C4-dicarboxylate transport system permease large subunit